MKNNIIKLVLISALMLGSYSCTDKEDTTITKVLDNVTNGAVLRTASVNTATFDFFNTASKWSITVEAQDNQNGELLKEVKVFGKHTKGIVTTAEKLLKTIPASAFQITGSRNLPQSKIELVLSDVLTTLAIATDGYTPSDKFTIRLEMVLTDGRVITTTNTSTPITNGYFNSPFLYSVQFFCPIANVSAFNGNYKVTADSWEDYTIGDIVPVSYVPADGTFTFRILCSANAFILNSATTYLIVKVKPEDGSATVTANQTFLYAPAIPATTVTGAGSVGSCTGDINLKLKFAGGYNATNQTFNLVRI
jgi:hypothetical protein